MLWLFLMRLLVDVFIKVIGHFDPDFRIPNCGICVYEYDGNKFKFIEMVDPNA